MNIQKIAQKIASAIKTAASEPDIENRAKYFGRKFDAYFEQGNGEEVVVAFMELYNSDTKLQKATQEVNRWVGIEHWLLTYKKHSRKFPKLFKEAQNV